MAVVSLFYAVFFVPELRGRGLEEVDEMFTKFHWGWQYKRIETHGYGAQIARLAAGDRTAAQEVEAENRKHEMEMEGERDLKVGLTPVLRGAICGGADKQGDVKHVENV